MLQHKYCLQNFTVLAKFAKLLQNLSFILTWEHKKPPCPKTQVSQAACYSSLIYVIPSLQLIQYRCLNKLTCCHNKVLTKAMIRVHFDKEIVSHLLKSLIFVEYILNCISMVRGPHHSLYSEPHECHSHTTSLRFVLVLSSKLQFSMPSCLLQLCCLIKCF